MTDDLVIDEHRQTEELIKKDYFILIAKVNTHQTYLKKFLVIRE